MDWLSGVAMQSTLLSWRSDGRLVRDGFTQAAIRAALFIDLTTDGRMSERDEAWVDTTRVGFGPVDRLLGQIDRHRNRTTGWWVGKGPAVQRDLATEWVRAGVWVARGKSFQWTNPDTRSAFDERRNRLQAIRDGVAVSDPFDAVMAALGQVSWMLDNTASAIDPDVPRDDLLTACGPSRQLVELAVRLIAVGRRTLPYMTNSGGSS
jgi:hypothetical protein